MNIRKNQNSILVLATLGVYLGLVIVGATPQVLAQETVAPENTIKIESLRSFEKNVAKRFADKEIDPTVPFLIAFEAGLTGKGMLDPSKSKVIRSEGDAKLVEVAKSGIEAFGECGYFQYFRQLKADTVFITASQDNESFSIVIRSDTKSTERARTIGSALKALIQLAKSRAESESDKFMLANTSVTNDGTFFTLSLVVPSAEFRETILARIAKANSE